jgi:N-acyl-D-amino-acid deacylase
MRREEPNELIVAHVMDSAEIENCVANPLCIVASDALMTSGGAHPRIAGTFPRALRVLRRHGYSWENALRKMTVLPAERMSLDGAGRLYEGAAADIVVFDPDGFADRATFQDPFTPPDGLELVVINGRVALKDGTLSGEPHGELSLA